MVLNEEGEKRHLYAQNHRESSIKRYDLQFPELLQ